MGTLHLRESDVRQLLTMELAIDAVRDGFKRLADASAVNVPRHRARTPHVVLHTMSAASNAYPSVGFKAYTTGRSGNRFHFFLYDGESGQLDAIIEADWLGRIRTGAASAVASECMARLDSSQLGIIGTGGQARTQVQAICCVRTIREVRVFGRDQGRREQFAREMEALSRVSMVPVSRPEDAAIDMDIVVTATSSRDPVLRGEWLAEGTHINAMGSNALNRAELDVDVIRRCDNIVTDSLEQCHLEAGDFAAALEQGILDWSRVKELSDVVAGVQLGRATSESVTLFESLGVAVEDLAVASRLLPLARERGLGVELAM